MDYSTSGPRQQKDLAGALWDWTLAIVAYPTGPSGPAQQGMNYQPLTMDSHHRMDWWATVWRRMTRFAFLESRKLMREALLGLAGPPIQAHTVALKPEVPPSETLILIAPRTARAGTLLTSTCIRGQVPYNVSRITAGTEQGPQCAVRFSRETVPGAMLPL